MTALQHVIMRIVVTLVTALVRPISTSTSTMLLVTTWFVIVHAHGIVHRTLNEVARRITRVRMRRGHDDPARSLSIDGQDRDGVEP